MIVTTGPSHLLVLIAVLVLIALVVVAIVATWRSKLMSTTEKVVLTLVLAFFPVIGLVVWLAYWLTTRSRRART